MEENTLIEFPNLERVLEEFAERARDQYKGLLIGKNAVASGSLYNTVECMIERNGSVYEVSLELEHYWKFLERGISPAGEYKNPGWKIYPFILKWIRIKPVIPRPMANGKLPSEKSLAYLISRSIKEHGIKPKPMLKEATDDTLKIFEDQIKEALAKDSENIVKKLFVTEIGIQPM